MVKLVCQSCLKEFSVFPWRKHQAKFCSFACRRKPLKHCEWCNKPHRKTRFCSKICYDKWQSDLVNLNCDYCQKVFQVNPCQLVYNNRNRPDKKSIRRFCSSKCRYSSDEFQSQAVQMNQELQKRNTTSVEKIGYALLEQIGTNYLKQHLINGKICVDAYVPDANLVIQFDGDYWHSHPKYKNPNKHQRKRHQIDKWQDAYLSKCGYRIIRLWETDLKTKPTFCRQQIAAYMTSIL